MSKLYFKVEADYEKVIKLREECKKLEEQLRNMDSGTSPASIKEMEEQLADSRKQMTGMVSDAAKAGASMERGFKVKIFEASRAVNELSNKIIAQRGVVRKASDDAKKMGEMYRDALKTNPDAADGLKNRYIAMREALTQERSVLFGLTQEQAKARLSVKKLRDEYNLYKKDSDGVTLKNYEIKDSFDGMSFSLGKAIGIIGGTAALKELGSEIVRVRGEFQEMETSIETMVGKNVASKIIPQIKELAKISPLTMSDMVGAEKMMLGFNIQAEDTIKYLKAMSDLSMGSSVKFNSLTLAFSQMSAAGKLMGQDLNQMISSGFNPLQVIAERTGKSIAQLKEEMSKGAVSAEMVQQAFIDATSEGGKFFKMSENASKTINGQISMMEDAMDAAFNDMGKASEGFIIDAISTTTSLIENYETVGKVLIGLVATYGTYKAALLAVMALEKAHAVQRLASIKGISAMSAATGLLTKKLGLLNLVMKANPYGMVAAVLTGLIATTWALSDSTSAAARAQKQYNKEKEDSVQKEQDHKEKVEELLEASKNEALATLERQKSLEELKKEYPNIFKEYDLERLKLEDILKLKRQINDEDSKKGVSKRKQNYEDLKRTLDNQRRYVAMYNNPKLRQNMSDEDRNIWKMFAGQPIVKVREQMRKNAELIKMYQKDVLADVLVSYNANLKSFSDEKLKREIEFAKSSAAKRNGFAVNGVMIKGQTLTDVISALEAEQEKRKKIPDYQQAYEKAERKWKEEKAKLEAIKKDMSKYTVKMYEDQVKEVEKAEAAFKKLGGDVTGKTDKLLDKEVKKQNDLLALQGKTTSLMSRYTKEFASQQKDLERKAAQARIDAMDDGYEKASAQRELNNRIELEDIERQKQEYIAKYIHAQKEIFDAQEDMKAKKDSKYKKKDFDASSVTVDTTPFDTLSADVVRRQGKETLAAQEDVWNRYLEQFGSFEEKKQDIIEKYNKKVQSAVASGNVYEAMLNSSERDKLISSLDSDKDVLVSYIEKAFGNISSLSNESLDVLIDKLKEYRKEAVETFDVEDIEKYDQVLTKLTNAKLENKFGLLKNMIPDVYMEQIRLQEEINRAQEEANELALKKLQLSADIAAKEKEILANIKAQTGVDVSREDLYSSDGLKGVYSSLDKQGKDSSGIKKSVGELVGLKNEANNVTKASDKAQKKMFSLFNMKSGGGTASTVATIDAIVNGINDIVHGVSDAMDEIKATKEALGKNTDIDTRIGKLAAGMKMFGEASQGATDAWNSLKKGDMGGMFAGVTKSFTGWIKGFAAIHDAKHEKVIEKIQERVDALNKSYEKLGKSIEDAYSHDAKNLIESQNKLLEQQKVLIRKQIREEDKKKHTDHKRIKEWQEQIEEINELIGDNKKMAVDAIFGEDVQSAIDNFANAYSEAWAKGEDKIKSAKDVVKDMMRQMVTESIKAAVQTSGRMEDIRNMLVSFYDDNVLSEWEQGYIYDMAERLEKFISGKFGWADSLMKDEKEDKDIKGLEDLQKAYDNLYDSVSKVYSSERVKAIQEQNDNLREQKRLIEERIAIEKDKDSLKDYKNQLEDINRQIEANKEAMKDAIFGVDIQSAIGEFVSAYTQALGKGDTSDVAEEFVENMVRGMIVEAMQSDASPVVSAVRDKLIEAWKDGVVSSEEQKSVKDLVDQLNKEFGDKYKWAEDLFKQETSEIKGLEDLQKAYNKLSEEMDKTYSSDRVKAIQEQIDLLEQQKKLIEENISKGGDKDIIKGWQQQLDNVNKEIAESKEAQIDAIFGSSVQSAVGSFANALIDAWAKGEDKAKSVADVTKQIIRGMVSESMKMDMAPMVEQLRESLVEMYKDGVISSDESSIISGMVQSMTDAMEKRYEWADQLIKEESKEIEGLNSLQRAYDKLSDKLDKVYSSERVNVLNEQIELLERQKTLLEGSIYNGGDKDVVENWQQQLDDINKEIADAKDAKMDAIFGSDIQSAISDFSTALIDAWGKGEDKAKSTQQIVKNIIRGMVAESMKMDMAPQVEEMRMKLTEMYKDGIISSDESSIISGLVKGMMESIEKQYGWADEWLKDEVEETFSNMTFESMHEGFVSQLSDIKTSYKDMCKSFEESLKESIIRGFTKSKYKSQIQNLIDTWNRYGDSGNIDENEIGKLREQYQNIVMGMIKDRDEIADKMGWTKFQQDASSKGFNTMSQETGEELNGRFTAMYESDLRREAILQRIENLLALKIIGANPIYPIESNGYNSSIQAYSSMNVKVDMPKEVFENIETEVSKLSACVNDIVNFSASNQLDLRYSNENLSAIKKQTSQIAKNIEGCNQKLNKL